MQAFRSAQGPRVFARRGCAHSQALLAWLVFVHVAGVSPHALAGTLKLYWSDGEIHRANLDGTQAEDIVQSTTSEYSNIAFDSVEQKLYWPSASAGGIEPANYDGSGIETAISGIAAPRSVAIDALNRKAYWLDYGWPNSIWRSNLDGTDREILYTTTSLPPLATAVDPVNGYYYWSGFHGDIHRTSLDGSDTKTVNFGELPCMFAIDSTNGYLYIADYLQHAIDRMRLDLSEPMVWLDRGNLSPTGIVIDPTNERLMWVVEQFSFAGRDISSIKLDGTDERTTFFAGPSGNYPPAGWTYLAIVDVPTPEPGSFVLVCVGVVLATFFVAGRR